MVGAAEKGSERKLEMRGEEVLSQREEQAAETAAVGERRQAEKQSLELSSSITLPGKTQLLTSSSPAVDIPKVANRGRGRPEDMAHPVFKTSSLT